MWSGRPWHIWPHPEFMAELSEALGSAMEEEAPPPLKRGRVAAGARVGLPKAIMFARANIGRAESYLTEIQALPKRLMKKEWFKGVESHIRDLEYRVDTLQGRTLQSCDEDVVPRITALSAALSGLVTLCCEVITFWRDGNAQTALAGIQATLDAIHRGPGSEVFASCKHTPPYIIEDMLRLHIIDLVRKQEIDKFPQLMQHEWVELACTGCPDSEKAREELRYRMVVQLMKSIGAHVSCADKMRSILRSLCGPVCPELRSGPVLKPHPSNASDDSMDFDIDLVTTSSREAAEQSLQAFGQSLHRELRVIAILPFFKKFGHDELVEALAMYANVSCPNAPRQLFQSTVYQGMVSEAKCWFEAEKAYREFCCGAMQKTRGFPMLHLATVQLIQEFTADTASAEARVQAMLTWVHNTFRGRGAAVLTDTDKVLDQLKTISPEHTSPERVQLDDYRVKFQEFQHGTLTLLGKMLQDVYQCSTTDPEVVSIEKKV